VNALQVTCEVVVLQVTDSRRHVFTTHNSHKIFSKTMALFRHLQPTHGCNLSALLSRSQIVDDGSSTIKKDRVTFLNIVATGVRAI